MPNPSAIVSTVFEAETKSDHSFGSTHAEEVNECIHPHFSFPEHLKWTCMVDTPATCAPTPITTLIDHGCSPVLILSDLMEILCLEPHQLFKLLSVSGTFMKNRGEMDSKKVLSEYCKLHIQSPDTAWQSHAINAIICPGLHTDLILGLEFLVKNKIIIDAEL